MEELKKQDNLGQKRFKQSCCHSYLTSKGRCYTCPELNEEKESENESDESDFKN